MPVLMIAEQPNLDEGTYAAMLRNLMPLLRSAEGSCPTREGRVPLAGCAWSKSGSPRRTAGSSSTKIKAESAAWCCT